MCYLCYKINVLIKTLYIYEALWLSNFYFRNSLIVLISDLRPETFIIMIGILITVILWKFSTNFWKYLEASLWPTDSLIMAYPSSGPHWNFIVIFLKHNKVHVFIPIRLKIDRIYRYLMKYYIWYAFSNID